MIRIGTPGQRTAIPHSLRSTLGVGAVLAAVVLTGLGTYYAGQSTAGPLDRSVTASVESAMPEANIAVLAVDNLGEARIAPLAVVLLAVVCAGLNRRRLAVVALTGPALPGLVMIAMKSASDRTIHGDNLSYPSGHTAVVTAMAIVVALLAVDLLRCGFLP